MIAGDMLGLKGGNRNEGMVTIEHGGKAFVGRGVGPVRVPTAIELWG